MASIQLRWWNGKGGAGRDIGLSLALLVLVGVLPVVAYSTGMAWLFVGRQQAAVEAELAGTSRALTVALDRELTGQIEAMRVLTTDPGLDGGDLANFAERTRRVRIEHPAWLDVALIAPRSHLVAAASVPVPGPAPATVAPIAVDEVVATAKPMIVGAFAAGTLVHGPNILLMAPVVRGGQVRYVLSVALDPAAIGAIFAEQQLPARWTGAFLDAGLRVAGRSRESGRYVGREATRSQIEHIAAADSGLFEAFTQEGEAAYTVFRRSAAPGWSVVIGIPAKSLDLPRHRMIALVAATGVVLVALALALAGRVGRGIVVQRRGFEDSLRAQARELERSNADLEHFAYVASHDLQTPLRNIASYAQLLRRRYHGRFDADADDFIAFIVDGVHHMASLINDLLEYARVSGVGRPLVPVAAGRACAAALTALRTAIAESAADIVVDDLPEVMADEAQMVSLFQNLIDNAIKYRHPGRPPRVAIRAHPLAPGHWRITVSDNGIGIEPHYFAKIFEMFQRLAPGKYVDGTGLGLALCQRIVDRFGGQIGVESVPDEGSTFYFTVSAAAE